MAGQKMPGHSPKAPLSEAAYSGNGGFGESNKQMYLLRKPESEEIV